MRVTPVANVSLRLDVDLMTRVKARLDNMRAAGAPQTLRSAMEEAIGNWLHQTDALDAENWYTEEAGLDALAD